MQTHRFTDPVYAYVCIAIFPVVVSKCWLKCDKNGGKHINLGSTVVNVNQTLYK